MFQNEQIFSKTDVSNYTVKMSDEIFNLEDKNFFWTKQQLNLIERDEKRVLFTSEFGTGKTTVLKAKAKNLAIKRKTFHESKLMREKGRKTNKKTDDLSITEDPGKTFVILFTRSDALLTMSVQNEFEDLKTHVEVITFETKREKDLIELVRANSNCNFFLDEVLVSKNSISSTAIATISTIISETNYLWIACQSDKLPNALDVNFRGKLHIMLKNTT